MLLELLCVALRTEAVLRIAVEQLGARRSKHYVCARQYAREVTHPLDELLALLVDDTLREPDLPKADVLVHLLRVLGVERAPPTAHFK